jgi:REP element-mobilizing transposase RayT
LFITFCLAGSVPRNYSFAPQLTTQALSLLDKRLEQNRIGPLWLRFPQVADFVCNEIRRADGDLYQLHAWVIMPNHVHLLITPLISVPRIMNLLKGRTARGCNQILGRTGQTFWQREYYDHCPREQSDFEALRAYVESNPVRAHLASRPEDYLWSSANPNWSLPFRSKIENGRTGTVGSS